MIVVHQGESRNRGSLTLCQAGARGIRVSGGFAGQICSPQQERGVSSYDATHQLNANWITELPFGRGRAIGSGAGGPLNAFIGGWQLSGLFRWTPGFPVNVDNGYSNFSDEL